ncbi:MAG TPA: hypothetical protein VGM54_09840 [Chthoniobacter sp.]|jgi:hypothetical protein
MRTSQPVQRVDLLNCRRIPGRLNAEQTALLLGFHEHDLGPLMAAGLLKPLGNPATNAPKYFAAVVVEELARDQRWLDRATRAIALYWNKKNQRKSSCTAVTSGEP